MSTLIRTTAIPSKDGSSKPLLGGLSPKAYSEKAPAELSIGLSRCAETSMDELCRQLAYHGAGDRTNFDIMRLAYALLSYVTATGSMSNVAGRELYPGQGMDPNTKIQPCNLRLVEAALEVFFAEQMENGLWDKGQPIYKSFRRTGINVGNAFVFATDTLGSLLGNLPAELFRPHLNALEKSLNWIENHQQLDIIADYCDVESGLCYGKPLRGWTTPHLPADSGPFAWSTAQTLTCVSRMRATIGTLMNNDVLREFGGKTLSEKGISLKAWNRLLDTDLGDRAESEKTPTLKGILEQRMVNPRTQEGNSYGAAYSAVLFGPPGTAKTTITESLAQRIGWDFLVIDTAAFLEDGLSNVASRIRYVFDRLQALEKCVILFDEIEEFCLDRETPGLGMESRMLTTAMLTAINDLRRGQRSIFFLATNRLRAFDSAITRPGRFDMQLFVGTPNLDAKVLQLQQKMAAFPIPDEKKALAEKNFREFLSSVWSETAMFFNYLEGLQFASACAEIVASGNDLTFESMDKILKAQIPVMIVRGTVRTEYLASMNLSRL